MAILTRWRKRPKCLPDGVVAEAVSPVSGRVARLIRKDGRMMCECPYACLATYEKCEFAGKFDAKGRAIKPWTDADEARYNLRMFGAP